MSGRHISSRRILGILLCVLQLGAWLRTPVFAAVVGGPEKARKMCPCCRSGHCTMPCCKKAPVPNGVASFTCLGGFTQLHAMLDEGSEPVVLNASPWGDDLAILEQPAVRAPDLPQDGFANSPLKIPIA